MALRRVRTLLCYPERWLQISGRRQKVSFTIESGAKGPAAGNVTACNLCLKAQNLRSLPFGGDFLFVFQEINNRSRNKIYYYFVKNKFGCNENA